MNTFLITLHQRILFNLRIPATTYGSLNIFRTSKRIFVSRLKRTILGMEFRRWPRNDRFSERGRRKILSWRVPNPRVFAGKGKM